MATRWSYVHNSMERFSGHPENFTFMQFAQNPKILMVSGKTIHMAFRTHATLYRQNSLEKIFIFIIYQNLTLAFNRTHFAKFTILLHKHKTTLPHSLNFAEIACRFARTRKD